MKKEYVIYAICVVFLLYIASVKIYQRIINPKLTETELFLLSIDNIKFKFKK